MSLMRKVLLAVGFVLGVYLIGRAIVELFVIDYGDPASYRADWGGPSLAGVLAVHSGPGVIAAALMVYAFLRWRRSASRSASRGASRSASRGEGDRTT